MDPAGLSRAVNPALCRMLHYERDDLIGRPLHTLTRQDDRAGTEVWGRLLSGLVDRFEQEISYSRQDGPLLCGLTTADVDRTQAGERAYFVTQIIDVTALREAEQAAARHAAAVEKSNAELEQFAYIASHDLQQPLRGISSYAALLADRYTDRLDPRGARWLAYITDGVGRMQRLIDDLLTLARVRIDGNNFEALDTAAVVRGVWKTLRSGKNLPRAAFTSHNLPTVAADPGQIEVLFENLLSNAIKYRRAELPLEIDVSAHPTGSNGETMWEFAVRDNGIGLDMKHAEQVFEIFRRLHRTDEYEGSGIGLAICRKIVTRHGGRIWVNSVPGEGATFSFTLREKQR
jgi:PAS domain S-box-containing protein